MYTQITKTELNDLIARKLDDEDKVYRTQGEINLIINEAFLTFAAISGYWKDRILIETAHAQQVYNLLDEADIKTSGQFNKIKIGYTYIDVLNWLDYDLIDYTQLITTDNILKLITNAINEFQSRTKLVVARQQYNIIVGERIPVSEDVLDIVAAYYIDSEGIYNALKLADEDRVSLFNTDWTNDNYRDKPRFYSINNLALNFVDLFPRPDENGKLELIYVKGQTGEIDENSSCLIPNNLVPYLKYKVLYDIFSTGDNADPFRAAYCFKRWQEGLIIGQHYSAITNIKINGLNKVLASFQDFDNLRYDWRNDGETIDTKINAIASTGYNIIATNRLPTQVYSILIEAIINAPTDDIDIDIRPDYIPYLLDYCLHLASIKDGIVAIQNTNNELERFMQIAVKHNIYLMNRRISYVDLLQRSKYPIKQARIEEEENAA